MAKPNVKKRGKSLLIGVNPKKIVKIHKTKKGKKPIITFKDLGITEKEYRDPTQLIQPRKTSWKHSRTFRGLDYLYKEIKKPPKDLSYSGTGEYGSVHYSPSTGKTLILRQGKYINIAFPKVRNPKSKHRFIYAPKGVGTIYRGDYELATQPQSIGRDLTGEEILQHLGGEAFAYMMTDEQVREAREGRKPGLGLPYRYIIKSPRSSALAWTAFFTREDMGKWLRAYDLSLSKEPRPGETFYVKLPKSTKKWLPLRRQYGKNKPRVKKNPKLQTIQDKEEKLSRDYTIKPPKMKKVEQEMFNLGFDIVARTPYQKMGKLYTEKIRIENRMREIHGKNVIGQWRTGLDDKGKKWKVLFVKKKRRKPRVKKNPLIEFYQYKFFTSNSNRDRDKYYRLLNKKEG